MGRLPGVGLSGKKTKLGTTIREESLEILNEYLKRSEGRFRSTGEAIDYLVMTFAGLDENNAAAYYEFSRDRIKKLEKIENSLSDDDFMMQKSICTQISQCEEIQTFMFKMTDIDLITGHGRPMQRIDMKDSTYLVIPTEGFVVLDHESPSECEYAGVVEIFHGDRINAPHFLFFSKFPIDKMSDFEKNSVYIKAARAWPKFKEVLENQVIPAYDEDGQMINYDEYMDSLQVHIFKMPEPDWGPDFRRPGHIMLYRQPQVSAE